jgi:K319-like protein
VFATSDEGLQAMQVSGAGVETTPLQGDSVNYVAHVAYTGAPPETVTVTNTSDTPDSVKSITVTDDLQGTAEFDTTSHALTVNAATSDAAGAPTLTLKNVEGTDHVLTGGTVTVADVAAPAATVRVVSTGGGSVDLPVRLTGQTAAPLPVDAIAGPDQTVLGGASVTLVDGGSTGPIQSREWSQVSGPTVELAGADSSTATFTAPDGDASLTFRLTVTGTDGTTDSDEVVVTVKASEDPPVADAGPDQTVDQTTLVTLDAGATTGATSYSWAQTGGTPTVTLAGASTATPTFTAPKIAGTLTFEVTATNAGGSTKDSVAITTRPDTLTVTAQYRTGPREWRIDGTSTVPGATVTIFVGPTDTGTVLARPVADALGAFRFRGAGTPPDATTPRITLRSSSGALVTVPVTVRR